MRVSRSVTWLSVVDLVVFAATYGERVLVLHRTADPLRFLYWISVWAGLVLAVYGFVALTRGGFISGAGQRVSESHGKPASQTQLKRCVLCILFAFIPACVALVTLLGHIGQPVGHVHVG